MNDKAFHLANSFRMHFSVYQSVQLDDVWTLDRIQYQAEQVVARPVRDSQEAISPSPVFNSLPL